MRKISLIDPIGGHGGMDYYDYGLAYGLGNQDLKVLYFTCGKTKDRSFNNVLLLNSFGNLWDVKGFLRLYFFLKGYYKSFKISNQKGSTLFHFQFFHLGFLNLLILILSTFFKQKKVVTLHDVQSFHKGSAKIISKWCLIFIDGIILHNQFSKTEFEKLFNFKGNTEIIPHGNYLPFINPQPLNDIAPTINLLFFGQIKDVKGVDILLKAMAEVVKTNQNIRLTIAGRPWKTGASLFENMVIEFNLTQYVNLHFRYIEDFEIEQFYKNADIVVLPYKKIYQSGVLLLTMSYGRTAIVSNLEPFTEVVAHNENGFVFNSEDSADLANCILGLNKDKIRNVTAKSKEYIEDKNDWLKIGLKTNKFYNSL